MAAKRHGLVIVILFATCVSARSDEATGNVYNLQRKLLNAEQIIQDGGGPVEVQLVINGVAVGEPATADANGVFKLTVQTNFIFDLHFSRQRTVTRIVAGLFSDGLNQTLNVTVPLPSEMCGFCRYLPPLTYSPAPAKLLVQLPADAKLSIDNYETKSTGTTRQYDSPPIPQGVQYFYTLKASLEIDGKMHEVSRQVLVRAGQTSQVSFDELVSLQQASTGVAERREEKGR